MTPEPLERTLQLRRPTLAHGAPALPVVALIALMMAGLLASLRADPAVQQVVRVLCVAPVALAAYRKRGFRPGFTTAAFFGAAFLWQGMFTAIASGRSGFGLEAVTTTAFLFLVAYAVAAIAESFWTQSVLEGAMIGSQGMLARSTGLSGAASYLVKLASSAADAESAALLLRHPVDRQWRLYGSTATRVEPPGPDEPLPLAWWLVEMNAAQRLNRMDEDPRFILSPDWPVHSLLAHPLKEQDGGLAALLILLNQRKGAFTPEDEAALAIRAAGVGQALEQAGLFARTDAALSRRANQLAALQTAARELNAELDFQAIGRQATASAIKITSADAGVVALARDGAPLAHHARGMHAGPREVRALLEWSRDLNRAALVDPLASGLPVSLGDATSAMVVPIRRGKESLGLIALAVRDDRAFDMQDLAAAAALADHVAVAMENARLFARLSDERETRDQIIRTLTEGLITTDAAGLVRSLNPAAETITGYTAADAIGRAVQEMLCSDPAPDCPISRALEDGQALREARCEITQPGGRIKTLSLSAAPLPGAGGLVIAVRDITEQDALDSLQRELAAAFSHGLRTPLASITLAIDMLLSDPRPPLSARQRAHLEIVRAQARRLADSTQRTLDVQRLDLGRFQLEARPLSLDREIGVAAARARGAGGRAVNLTFPEARLWAWADEAALHTVLDNLFDNALRYSPAGSPVEVQAVAGPGSNVTISVLDRGAGIVENQRELVFERFYGPDAESAYGHGLGLYLSRRLVERMGGRIWFEPRDGGGSCLSFTLPAYVATRHDI